MKIKIHVTLEELKNFYLINNSNIPKDTKIDELVIDDLNKRIDGSAGNITVPNPHPTYFTEDPLNNTILCQSKN